MNCPCIFVYHNRIPNSDEFYSLRMLGGFQVFIESIITKLVLKSESASLTYGIVPMMSNPYNRDSLGEEYGAILIMMYTIFCGTITLIYLISRMQVEKNNKMRDFMRMMGMNDTPYYLSYFIIHLIISLLSSSIITTIVKINFELKISIGILYIQILLMYINIYCFAILMKYFFIILVIFLLMVEPPK